VAPVVIHHTSHKGGPQVPVEAWVDTQYRQGFGSGIMANWIQTFRGIYTLTSGSVLNSDVECKEGTELKNYEEVNKEKQKYKDHNKSNNTILDHQKLEWEAKNQTSATTDRKSLLDRIIIGVCVVLSLLL
jgi:hypothetical protein